LGLGGGDGHAHSRTVMAMTDVHLSFFSQDAIRCMCEKHPALGERLKRLQQLRKLKQEAQVRAEKWSIVLPGEQAARDAFHEMDTDGSGSLDREELTRLIEDRFQLKLSIDELEDAFAELDTDGNGVIDVDEFVRVRGSLLLASHGDQSCAVGVYIHH
jgi:CRP-like cAMP-binding protein